MLLWSQDCTFQLQKVFDVCLHWWTPHWMLDRRGGQYRPKGPLILCGRGRSFSEFGGGILSVGGPAVFNVLRVYAVLAVVEHATSGGTTDPV